MQWPHSSTRLTPMYNERTWLSVAQQHLAARGVQTRRCGHMLVASKKRMFINGKRGRTLSLRKHASDFTLCVDKVPRSATELSAAAFFNTREPWVRLLARQKNDSGQRRGGDARHVA